MIGFTAMFELIHSMREELVSLDDKIYEGWQGKAAEHYRKNLKENMDLSELEKILGNLEGEIARVRAEIERERAAAAAAGGGGGE